MSKHLKKCLTIVRKILFGISGSHRTEASVFRKFGLVRSTTDWPALLSTGWHYSALLGTAQHCLALTTWHCWTLIGIGRHCLTLVDMVWHWSALFSTGWHCSILIGIAQHWSAHLCLLCNL